MSIQPQTSLKWVETVLTGYPGLSFLNLTDERSSLFLWFWHSVLEKLISKEYVRYLDISMVILHHSFFYLLSQVPPQNPICTSLLLQIASWSLPPLYMVSGDQCLALFSVYSRCLINLDEQEVGTLRPLKLLLPKPPPLFFLCTQTWESHWFKKSLVPGF